MKEKLLAMRPLLLRLLGYPAFFMFFFALFAYVTFPYDRVKEAAIAAVEAPRRTPGGGSTPSNMQLTIGDLGPTFLPGLNARNVNLTFLPARAGERATTMHLDDVVVHPSLLGLLTGTLRVAFEARGLGGTMRGSFATAFSGSNPGLREIHAQLEGVRAGDIAPLVQLVGLPLLGRISGTIDLTLPEGRTNRASGAARLTIADLRVGDGRAQYQIPNFGALTVEQIRAGTLTVALDVNNGVATIREFRSSSPEFQLAMDGEARLAPVFGQSTINAGVRLRLTDAYRTKSEQAGRIMMALDFMSSARRPDGMLAFRCTGTFDRMHCPPDTRAGGARPTALPARRGFGL